MKNKIVPIGLFVALFLLIAAFVHFKPAGSPSRPVVQSIDEKGIYVGKGKSGLEPVSDEASQYTKTVKALHEGWDQIGLGDSYNSVGRYEEAIKAYKRAYEIDPGNRGYSGMILIETYEALSLYDDALRVLDEISKRKPISEYGIKKYAEIRTHLLAVKEEMAPTLIQQMLQSHEYFRLGRYQEAEAGYIALTQVLKGKVSEAVIHDSLLNLYLATNDRTKAVIECDWLIEHGATHDKIRGDAVKKDIAFKMRKEAFRAR